MAFVKQDVGLVGLNGLFWPLNLWIEQRKEKNKTKQKNQQNKSACYNQHVSPFWKQSWRDCIQLVLERSAGEDQGHCSAQALASRAPHPRQLLQPTWPPKPNGIFWAPMANTRHGDVLKAQPIFTFFPLPLDIICVFQSYKSNAFSVPKLS